MTKPSNRWAYVLFVVILLGYLLITSSALTSDNHILYNLEPYPDGLLYALSARNAALHQGLNLLYGESRIHIWVPALYTLILVPFYVLSTLPWMFYIANVVLGLCSVITLFYIVSKMTRSSWAGIVSVVIYLSHALILWLPTVPMSENLTLLLVLLSLIALVVNPTTKWMYAISLSALVGMLFTRYAIAPVAVVGIALLFFKFFKFRLKEPLLALLILLVVIGICELLGYSLLTTLKYLVSSVWNSNQYYNVSNVMPNLRYYGQVVWGAPKYFLWLLISFTSPLYFLTFMVMGTLTLIKGNREERFSSITLLLLFLAQLPLLLMFYSTDSRYIILTIPIMAVMVGWTFSNLSIANSYIKTLILLIIIGLQLFSQIPLFKQVLANNLLHKSNGWQYLAIQHFDEYFSQANTNDVYLITALPPHLVAAYQKEDYELLPLSNDQEFLQKGEHVWGEDVPYDSLVEGYKAWIEQGKIIYITNAYITHQQSVIYDFEKYKEAFVLEQVSEGCSSACNIYKLKLSDTATSESPG